MIPKDRPAPGIHGDEESKGSFGVSEPTGDLYLLSRGILKKFEITLVASIVQRAALLEGSSDSECPNQS